ncbi:DUF998 domain-containing protein [Actinoplanes sp. DH11]|uniref:DUF998 domain-containing protein n=1 Tax=Actinoplanes sp. DH11 TaxID=2857011 RepID=UPI001E391BB6|nr:DUF998 domain-containing protein [Actinoplanes sp. DH11]
MSRNRLAVTAAVLVTAGAAVMLVTLVAQPGPWWRGYVSEVGVAGRPYAMVYRCGLLLLALGVAVLGQASRRARVLLLAAAGFAGTSGAVACSDRCPLPPYEPTTPADVIHTAAAILGMVVLAAAMAVTWWEATRPAIRRLTAAALALLVPVGAVLGVTMLVVGRGTTGAVLERVMLAVAVSWLVGTALLSRSEAAATGTPDV